MTPKEEETKRNLCPDTSQDKEKSFKEAREIPTMEARGEWNKNFNMPKIRKVLYPEKTYFKNQGEIQTFENKPKQNLPCLPPAELH